MGNNFYTKWINKPNPGYTTFKVASMDPALAGLDRGITYQKNVIVSCDGVITYNKATGVVAWSDVIRIHFNRADGQAILNTIAAGDITLADNEFFYVTLSETDSTALTASKAAITTSAASNFLAYNILVLGYRNAASDEFYPVHLPKVEDAVVTLSSAEAVTVYWNLGKVQKITLGHDVTFTFSGAKDGDRLILSIKQNDSEAKTVTLPVSVRFGTDITEYVVTETLDAKDKIGFIYDGDDSKYDLVSVAKGF